MNALLHLAERLCAECGRTTVTDEVFQGKICAIMHLVSHYMQCNRDLFFQGCIPSKTPFQGSNALLPLYPKRQIVGDHATLLNSLIRWLILLHRTVERNATNDGVYVVGCDWTMPIANAPLFNTSDHVDVTVFTAMAAVEFVADKHGIYQNDDVR